MPEGPEIKKVVDNLENIFGNFNIKLNNVLLNAGRYTKNKPKNYNEFIKELPLKINSVNCKGKFIWFEFENNWSAWITFGMTGRFTLDENLNHNNVSFVFNKFNLYFNDIRNFGTIMFYNNPIELDKKLKSLGPDILNNKQFSLDVFKNLLLKKTYQNKEIGVLLMEQKFISGIGNYLRAEILYDAKINPFRIISSLNQNDITNLYNSIIKISKQSYDKQVKTYVSDHNELNKYTSGYKFLVYQRTEDKFGNPVKNEKLGTRTMWWVPNIQK